jgi:hypothetical protein
MIVQIAMRVWPILLLIPIAAQCADEDGTRVDQVKIVYFIEPVQITINPSELLFTELAAASERSGDAPAALTVNGRTTIVAPKGPTPRAAFDTWVAPLARSYQESIQTGLLDTKWAGTLTVMDRFVRDNFRHVYVSYTLTVETLTAGNYRATFSESQAPVPASTSGWTVISPVSLPVPQFLQDGDTLTLDLYSDSETGQKVVEDIHFDNQPPTMLRKGAARQVYADDDLKISQPRVRKNGVAQELGDVTGTLDGSAFWIFLPGDGRYVLSLKPEAGFKRAGEVVGNTLQFMVGGNVFRVDCSERIADAGSGTYAIFASRDPAWEPADPKDRARLVMGSLTGEKH